MNNVNIGCIIVTYNPDESRFEKVITSITDQCNVVLLVDNKSRNTDYLKEICQCNSKLKLIELDRNYGIAKAINIGVDRLKSDHLDWILMLDQDTFIFCDIKKILTNLNAGKTGIVWLGGAEEACEAQFTISVKPIIISGSVISWKVFSNGAKFREEFFLDHVDTDFDFRVKNMGFKVLRICKSCIDHQWGKEKIIKGKKIRYTTNLRLYLTVRNGTRLLLEKKIGFRIFLGDNLYYFYYNVYNLKNFLYALCIAMYGFADGVSNNFLFLNRFSELQNDSIEYLKSLILK